MMLVVMFLGAFVTILNQTVVAPALPAIMAEQGIDAATGQWLTTGFTLVNAVMIPITAFLIERFSTRQLFIASMASFLLGSVLCTVAPNFPVLFAGRIFQAIAAGVMMPMVMTTLVLMFPVKERGAALGTFGLIISFAPAIGPTLAGIIIDAANWHIMFGIVSVLSVIVVVFAAIALENMETGERTSAFDVPSVIFSTLGFGGLLYGFSLIGSEASVGPVSGGAAIVGIVCIVAFFWRQTRLAVPMLHVDVFDSPRFAIATVIGMIVQAALLAAPILLPIYAQSYLGYSATVSGLMMLPGACMLAVLSPVTGRLFDKYGPRALGITGGILLVVGSIGLCTLTLDTPIWLTSLWFFLRCCGIATINMPVTTWGVNSLDNSMVSHANSLNNTLRQVTASFGTAIVVSVMTIVAGMGPNAGAPDQGVFGIDVAFAVTAVLNVAVLVLIVAKVRYDSHERDGIVSVPSGEGSLLRQLMTESGTIISSGCTVQDALSIIYDKHISGAPIVNESGVLVGFISDGDIMRCLADQTSLMTDSFNLLTIASSDDRDIHEKIDEIMALPVMDVATRGVVAIDVNTDMGKVCHILGRKRLKKAPVTENGKFIGMIDRWDIDRYALETYVRNTMAPAA